MDDTRIAQVHKIYKDFWDSITLICYDFCREVTKVPVQGEDIKALKAEALQQILDNRYYESLRGEVVCMGVAHDKKKCALAHKTVIGG